MQAFTLEEYQQYHLNPYRLNYAYQQKWFKLFVPKSFQGLELTMQQGCQKLLEIAEIQGGLGWTINLGAGANWFAGFFDEQIAHELFSPEKAVVAGSGAASGSWQKVDQGFLINGEWTKCTGAHHATLFTLNAEHPQQGIKTFIIPRNQVELSPEKWPIMGMRNSSSFGIKLDNSLAPNGYDFAINHIKNNHHYAALHLPFKSFARLCITASYLGLAQCLLNHSRENLTKPQALNLIDKEIQPTIKQAETQLYQLAENTENLCLAKKYTAEDQAEMHNKLGQKNIEIFEKIQQLFLAGGLAFIEEDSIVHWAYRDLLTAAQHYMVKP